MRAAVLVAGLFLGVLAGCKGDRVKCEEAARNYAKLVYWQRADAEIALLPKDKQDAERKERVQQFTAELANEIDFITEQCVNANNDDQIACMIAAKTGTEAKKCADLITKD